MHFTSRLPLAVPIAALAMLVFANNASAQKTETIEGGRTTGQDQWRRRLQGN